MDVDVSESKQERLGGAGYFVALHPAGACLFSVEISGGAGHPAFGTGADRHDTDAGGSSREPREMGGAGGAGGQRVPVSIHHPGLAGGAAPAAGDSGGNFFCDGRSDIPDRWFGRGRLSFKTVQIIACAVVAALFFFAAPAPVRGNIGFSSLGDHPGFSPFQIAWKGDSGFGALLDRLLADPANKDAVFLISSDARGEGMFVSEFAMRDARRPGHIIRRAGKLLASSAWNGSGYKAQFTTEEAVLKALIESPAQLPERS